MNQASQVPSASTVRVAGFEVDLAREQLRTAAGVHVELRPRSFAVLRLLAANAGRLVSKDEIMSRVWDHAIVTEDSLTQCIADIRRALRDEDRRIVRTVPRKGYLLASEVAPDVSHEVADRADPMADDAGPPDAPGPPGWPAARPRRRWLAAGTAALIVLLVTGAAAFWPRTPPELRGRVPDRPALAVLPFRPIIPDTTNNIWAAVQGWQIFSELARNPHLPMRAYTASLELWRQRNLTPSEIGTRVRVRYVADGRVQRYGDQLAIDVYVIDVRDDTVAFQKSFRAGPRQVGELDAEISRNITQAMYPDVPQPEKQAIAGRSPRDLDVYEITLRGLHLMNRFEMNATRRARRELDEVLQRDPHYALAWTVYGKLNLADILNRFTGEWTLDHLDAVITQFNRSVELDPYAAMTHQGLGRAWLHKGDFDRSLEHFRKAVQLAPGDTDYLLFLGWMIFQKGNVPEGLRLMGEALGLNPVRPAFYYSYFAEALWATSRHQGALEHSEECLRKSLAFSACHIFRILALIGLGRKDEAASSYHDAIARLPLLDKAIISITPPNPEFASRFRGAFASIGWKAPVAASGG